MKENSERTWLILAHCFNMDGRAASQTITDRLPRLMAGGVRPVVISAPTGRKYKGLKHYRIFSPAPSNLLFELRQIIDLKFQSIFLRKTLKTLLTLLLLPFYILEKIFIHLDSHWSWFIGVVCLGTLVISRKKPVLIYSTAGPSSTHWAGYILSKLFGLPWLAEIHDPLILDTEKTNTQRYFYQKKLEETISRNAAATIYFTENALSRASARHPFKGRTYVIRPGAEPPDYVRVHYARRSRIHFAHFGSLGVNRNLCPFIQSLSEIVRSKPELKDMVRLDVFGTKLDDESRKCLDTYPLGEILVEHDRLEYDPETGKSGRQQVLEEMQKTDVLLLMHGHGEVCEEYIPSKFYEYVLTGRPVLGLVTPGSEIAVLMQELGHYTVDGKKADGIQNTLLSLIQKWQANSLSGITFPNPFSLEKTVDTLFQIEAEIVS